MRFSSAQNRFSNISNQILFFQSDGSLEFRHYTIKVVPVGASRPVKKLVVQSKIPNLGRYDDISDVLVSLYNFSDIFLYLNFKGNR
jgi:hypothetical protein